MANPQAGGVFNTSVGWINNPFPEPPEQPAMMNPLPHLTYVAPPSEVEGTIITYEIPHGAELLRTTSNKIYGYLYNNKLVLLSYFETGTPD